MSDKEFASNYNRTENGHILFPGRDTTWRRQLFPEEVFEHPAKANMYLVQELVRYLTEPGDTILDPFGGTGTLLIATLEGRNVVLIDIEPQYVGLIDKAWKVISANDECEGELWLHEGDCRQRLLDIRHLCDAAIFSPPYANFLSSGGETRIGTGYNERITPDKIAAYGGKQTSVQNLGRLNPFYFEQAMVLVYKRLAARLVPNAPMAIISKDAMRAGRREILSERIIRHATRSGFRLEEWHKWRQPMSSYRAPAAAKGIKTVDDEDIIIFRKEE